MKRILDRLASRRGVLRGAALGSLVLAASCAAAEPVQALVVHRDPGCGCCHVWVAHMQQTARFEASVRDEVDMPALKRRLGVPADLASCHTAEVAGFIIEGHVPAADDSLRTAVTLLSHASDAVTAAAAGMASHWTVASAGTPASAGAVVSCTVMTWLAELLLPQSSVAVQVRVIV